MIRTPYAAVALASALLGAPAAAAELFVGPAGSGQAFSDIQAAIDAASPGDTVYVLAGTYGRFELDKPLRLIGAGSTQVLVDESDASLCSEGWMSARVSGIPAGTEALVAGMSFQAPPPPSLFSSCFTVRVAQNDGVVVMHDVVTTSPLAALDVHDSEFVLISSSTLRAVYPPGTLLPGNWSQGTGLRVTDSNVWVGDSVLEGLGATPAQEQVFGHPGLKVINANVFIAGTDVVGGDGGLAPFGTCSGQSGYAGAPGALVAGSSYLRIAGGPTDTIRAGAGGQLGACSGEGASAIHVSGPGLVYRPANVTLEPSFTAGVQLPATEISAAGSEVLSSQVLPSLAVAVPGSFLEVKLGGVANWNATLFAALAPSAPLAFPGVDGSGALDPTSLLFQLPTTLDTQGERTVTIPLPNLVALQGVSVYFQWLQKEPGTDQRALSNPTTVVF